MSDAPTRRTVLGAAMLGTLAAPLAARTRDQAPTPRRAPGDGETIQLWPGLPPGAPTRLPVLRIDQRSKDPTFDDRWVTGIDRPFLAVHRPANPNGAAVLLLPGGGYGFLSWDNEGEEQARWLVALGVTCFILAYRLPTEGWSSRALVPLQDTQRAMRLIRARAAAYGIDAEQVSVLGFSAGGHLAGSIATRHAERSYAPVDAADRLSARPDLAGLVYPVVSLSAPFVHAGSRDNLLGTGAADRDRRTASVEQRVDAATPPIFLAHASDDGLVPVTNSIAFYQAMVTAKRPAECHLFDEGGHGFGVRLPQAVPAAAWPRLFTAYARRKGAMPPL